MRYDMKRIEMSDMPENLKYAKSHEWSVLEENNTVRVGITDFAQAQLGDLVYIDLPEVGRQLTAGEQCAVVESVKTASDLFSPVTGVVTAINEELEDSPEQVNDEPFATWLFCIKTESPEQLNSLMDASAYQLMIDE
jgi:glycine cleavage system H protein